MEGTREKILISVVTTTYDVPLIKFKILQNCGHKPGKDFQLFYLGEINVNSLLDT